MKGFRLPVITHSLRSRVTVMLSLVLVGFFTSFGVTERSPFVRAAAETTPTGVHLTCRGDPRSSIVVQWYTNVAVTAPKVKYGLVPLSLTNVKAAEKRTLEGTVFYFAELVNLVNKTQYFYQVGDDIGGWSATFNFTTAPDRRNPVSFLAWGDSRGSPYPRSNLSQRALELGGFNFTLHGGDEVSDGMVQSQWNQYFTDLEPLYASVPSYFASGNHEWDGTQTKMYDNVVNPSNGRTDLWQYRFFTFFWGPVQVMVLDSNNNEVLPTDGIPVGWIDTMFQNGDNDNSTLWKVVIFHHPVYEIKTGRTDYMIGKQEWGPVFTQHQLDVTLVSHSHFYSRNYPMDFFGNYDNSEKWYYENLSAQGKMIQVVTAGAGAPLYDHGQTELPAWHLYFNKTYHFTRFNVDFNETHSEMTMEAWAMPYNGDTGEVGDLVLIDNFTIVKRLPMKWTDVSYVNPPWIPYVWPDPTLTIVVYVITLTGMGIVLIVPYLRLMIRKRWELRLVTSIKKEVQR